ncbi:hypothetical protein LUZ62_014786 [Rhynchospora pubera]|uniref:Uncharacterized protein n=1 Tax=Rhynchospora pubera TaxID=906938 RepID=A0AAV8G985_9POAL|nr:hypothetical protein LUZ62_014786 [Rhynchospora pubera]
MENNCSAQNKEKHLNMEREQMSNGSVGTRDKLRRLKLEMGGRVCIPDTWGQESRLQDWANCTAFTGAYMPAGLASARAALAESP